MSSRTARAGRGFATLMLGMALAACSTAAGESPEESPEAAASGSDARSVAPSAPASAAASAAASGPAALTDPYGLPDGSWSGGSVHLEITGGFEATIDLPFVSGDTASGSTALLYRNQDDENYSVGEVRLSFVIQADGISIMSGGLNVLGPCEYTFSEIAVGALAGELRCEEDLQALVEGDPREVVVTGTFTGAAG